MMEQQEKSKDSMKSYRKSKIMELKGLLFQAFHFGVKEDWASLRKQLGLISESLKEIESLEKNLVG